MDTQKLSETRRLLDERLSKAQHILRDGYHDDLSRAIAKVRDLFALQAGQEDYLESEIKRVVADRDWWIQKYHDLEASRGFNQDLKNAPPVQCSCDIDHHDFDCPAHNDVLAAPPVRQQEDE
jgi:hypothetical protein